MHARQHVISDDAVKNETKDVNKGVCGVSTFQRTQAKCDPLARKLLQSCKQIRAARDRYSGERFGIEVQVNHLLSTLRARVFNLPAKATPRIEMPEDEHALIIPILGRVITGSYS